MTDRERVLSWFEQLVAVATGANTAANVEVYERLRAGGALDPKPKKARVQPTLHPNARLFAETLFDCVLSNNPEAKRPHLITWALEFHRIICNDDRSTIKMMALLRWSQADPFWSTVILSPAAFRRNYDKLTMARKRSLSGGTSASDAKPLPPPSKGQES